jgi:hypothetical protein
MQEELAIAHPDLGVSIVNVNGLGHSRGNPGFETVTTLPLLQESDTTRVWDAWGAEWRDVYVLDRENEVYAVFNLNRNPLEDRANYDALYALFVEAGTAP